MRSVDPDRTAAAVIRDAAMRLFGERGPAGVSIRDVAAEAGVSPALVIHHYTSKAGLKAAVDERAMHVLGEMFARAGNPETLRVSVASMAQLFADEIGRLPDVLPYLRRLLIDGGEAAEALFRGLFEATRAMLADLERAGVVAPAADPDARAAFLLVNDLGAMVLREQVRAVLGIDPVDPDGIVRWGEAVMAVYSAPVFLTPPESEDSEEESP